MKTSLFFVLLFLPEYTDIFQQNKSAISIYQSSFFLVQSLVLILNLLSLSFILYMLSRLCLLCPEDQWTFEFGQQDDDHLLTSFSTSFPFLIISLKMEAYLSFLKNLEYPNRNSASWQKIMQKHIIAHLANVPYIASCTAHLVSSQNESKLCLCKIRLMMKNLDGVKPA